MESHVWLAFFHISQIFMRELKTCLLMPCGHLLGKGWPLGSRLWCLIRKLSLSHLVSWVRCGAWLYWFLIFVLFLTLGRWLWRHRRQHGALHSHCSGLLSICGEFLFVLDLSCPLFGSLKETQGWTLRCGYRRPQVDVFGVDFLWFFAAVSDLKWETLCLGLLFQEFRTYSFELCSTGINSNILFMSRSLERLSSLRAVRCAKPRSRSTEIFSQQLEHTNSFFSLSEDCLGTSKQCGPSWNDALCGISSGPLLFAKVHI